MKKVILLIALSWMNSTFAQSDKKYTLFNPVPKDKMRGLNTDRPDITESPISVDAGHFQIETDLFRTTRNKVEIENSFNLANLKLGLTNRTDLQLVVESFVNNYTKDKNGNKLDNSSGFGDLTLRLKYNLWGNDEGKTAFAVMPYINFPTSVSNSNIEAGIVFPFSVDLGNDFGFGTQVQFDLAKSELSSGYHSSFLQSATLGKEFSKSFEAFAESYYTYDTERKNIQLSVNGGIGYLPTENLKFDIGFNYGLTKNTDNVYFIGFSFRY